MQVEASQLINLLHSLRDSAVFYFMLVISLVGIYKGFFKSTISSLYSPLGVYQILTTLTALTQSIPSIGITKSITM